MPTPSFEKESYDEAPYQHHTDYTHNLHGNCAKKDYVMRINRDNFALSFILAQFS
jgi:hypothetical protein